MVDGFKAVTTIGSTPIGENDRPNTPQTIDSAEVISVTPGHNPYAAVGVGK